MTDTKLSCLPYAFNKPQVSGQIRQLPQDFCVLEDLGYEPSGDGEHVCLLIQKIETNTTWLAENLAKFAGIKPYDVGFAGLKDRHAVTTQWFSLYLPKNSELNWQELETENIKILKITRHNKKLRRGNLTGNHFQIVIRHLMGDTENVINSIKQIQKFGVPNYFGPQRFGFNGNNISQADLLFNGKIKTSRHKRSMYLSAVRSWLFNLVLAKRIDNKTWNTASPGDVMMLSGSNSFFVSDTIDESIKQRIANFDISPSGPLYGRGNAISKYDVLDLEESILQQYPTWLKGLEKANLKQERRQLVLNVENFEYQLLDNMIELKFFLRSGSYATSVIRELITATALT